MAVKEEIKQAFKISRKTFFNPRAWFGYDFLKDQTQSIWTLAKTIFSPKIETPAAGETFDDAMRRLAITEPALHLLQKNYFYFSLVLSSLGLLGFIVAFLFLFNLHLVDFILACCVGAILFSQAFRFHFWYFQMKHRKLGCTFAEWYSGKIKNAGEK